MVDKTVRVSDQVIELLNFKLVESDDKKLIHDWLKKPHIAEWLHGVGLENTLEGLEESFQGESLCKYWIAYDAKTPFAFLITSDVRENDFPYSKYCEKSTVAITLDVFICVVDYLGKGIGSPLIRKFLESKFSHVTDVFIDPQTTNIRAVKAYEKVGFEVLETYNPPWLPVPHYLMRLKIY